MILEGWQGRRRVFLLTCLIALAAVGAWWCSSLVRELMEPASQGGNHDFLAFYTAGELVRAGNAAALYSASALTELQRAIYPQPTGYQGYLPFLNPPSAAVLLAPLSALPFGVSRLVWLAISLLCGAGSVILIGRDLSPLVKVAIAVLVFLSYPAYQAMGEGQWSYVLLLSLVLAVRSHERGRPFVAGLLVSVLWLKPPLLLLAIIWLCLRQHGRVLLGVLCGLAFMTVVTLPWTGLGAYADYVRYSVDVLLAHAGGGGAVVANASWEGALPNMEGLLGLSATLVGQANATSTDLLFASLSLLMCLLFLAGMRGRWHSHPLRLDLALSALALGVLLDVHAYAQDCLLLALGVFLVLERRQLPWARPRHGSAWTPVQQLGVAVAGLVVLDLSGLDANWIGAGALRPIHLLAFVLMACVAASAIYGAARINRSQFARAAEAPAV